MLLLLVVASIFCSCFKGHRVISVLGLLLSVFTLSKQSPLLLLLLLLLLFSLLLLLLRLLQLPWRRLCLLAAPESRK